MILHMMDKLQCKDPVPTDIDIAQVLFSDSGSTDTKVNLEAAPSQVRLSECEMLVHECISAAPRYGRLLLHTPTLAFLRAGVRAHSHQQGSGEAAVGSGRL